MVKRICNFPGCNKYAEEDGYCLEHIQYKPKPFQYAKRSNEGLYNTTAWRHLRALILEEQKTCQVCGSTENLTVDHIIPPEGDITLFFNERNLQVLCHSCHCVKTAAECKERYSKD